MEKFLKLSGTVASIELSNIDTDMIIPKQFLKTIKRSGLGKGLFYEMRFDENGNKISKFILNKRPYNKSKILVALENFGCGSSREHAPWALIDFGIKVILAKSFADIFYNNCFKNGILPIKLADEKIQEIINFSKKKNLELEIDLENQTIRGPEINFSFEIDTYKKTCLLNGWDDIDLTLKKENLILEYEKNNSKSWLKPKEHNE
jgi:3-isopropylmalate/(R)-2-methylmalate dehydratase small subunit